MRATPRWSGPDPCAHGPAVDAARGGALGHDATGRAAETADRAPGHHQLEGHRDDSGVERRAVVRVPHCTRRGRCADRGQTRQERRQRADVRRRRDSDGRRGGRWRARRRRRRRNGDARFLGRLEVGRVHDLSVAPRGPAAPASAAARPEQRNDRQSGDEREARVSTHPAVCVLGRCVDLDRAAPASGHDGGSWPGRGSRCRWRRADVWQRGGWCGTRSTARHGPHPARARERAGAERRQRRRLHVFEETAACSRGRSMRRTRSATACSSAT